jgi:hypothetical protein
MGCALLRSPGPIKPGHVEWAHALARVTQGREERFKPGLEFVFQSH